MALLSAAAITAADARHRQGVIVCNLRGCSNQSETTATEPRRVRVASYSEGEVVGHRPAGCPHEFCGCEASLYLFGQVRPELNLASNWIRKFPRVAPAPGMAAARSGHVMVLISHVSGDDWMVHDGNSGGGLTRDHVRSIRGYVIVDPQETMFAKRSKPTQVAATPAPEPHATPTHVASATFDNHDAAVMLPKPRPIEAAIEDMAAANIKHVSFPPELMASAPIGQMHPVPFERVAATLVERWSMLDSTSASVDGPVPVQVEHVGTLPAKPTPMPPVRETPAKQTVAVAADPVPLPASHRPDILAERTAAIPIDQVPVPPVRALNAQAEQIATIPIEPVPLPRARLASIAPAPEQTAAIRPEQVPLPRARLASFAPEPEHVPLPRQRPASIAAEQVASLVTLDYVRLPNVRASVGVPETAVIPNDDVPLPRVRLATRSPEAPEAARDPVASRQFMEAATGAEHTPVPKEEALRVSNEPETPHRTAHWRHGRHDDPSLAKQAASAVENALTSVRKMFHAPSTHKSRRGNWS